MTQTTPQVGMRLYKNGVRIDVDFVKNGKVYCRKWPRNVRRQSFFANLFWVNIQRFQNQIKKEQPRVVMP